MTYDDESGAKLSVTFEAPGCAVSAGAFFDPASGNRVSGLVSVRFSGWIAAGESGVTLRKAETDIAALVALRLADYEKVVKERDELRRKLERHGRSTDGFSTAELMWRADHGE